MNDRNGYTDMNAADEPRDGEVLPALTSDMSPAISAEIFQQVATAHRFPRRRDKEISDEIMGRATLNEEIAAECMYTLTRGEKLITGASIRFAEIARASYGNIRVAARFVRLDLDDRERGAVLVEALALDLQGNGSEVIPVRRSIMTSGKGGRRPSIYSADMINMTVNAATSLARRNAILAVIPKAVWILGYQRVVKVLKGDANTLGRRRAEMIEAFGRVGVTPERVFEALGVRSIEDITLEHMPQLAGFATAIKEGETPDAVFGRAMADQPTHATVNNPLKDDEGDAPKANTKAQQQQADAAEAGADPKTGEMPKTTAKAAAATEKPAGETAKPEGGKAAPKANAAAAANPKVGAKASQAAGEALETLLAEISTPSEYEAYALAWIGKLTDSKAGRARWTAERNKRSSLDLEEDVLVRLSSAQQAKIKELEAAS